MKTKKKAHLAVFVITLKKSLNAPVLSDCNIAAFLKSSKIWAYPRRSVLWNMTGLNHPKKNAYWLSSWSLSRNDITQWQIQYTCINSILGDYKRTTSLSWSQWETERIFESDISSIIRRRNLEMHVKSVIHIENLLAVISTYRVGLERRFDHNCQIFELNLSIDESVIDMRDRSREYSQLKWLDKHDQEVQHSKLIFWMQQKANWLVSWVELVKWQNHQ